MGNNGKIIIAVVVVLLLIGLIGSCSEDSEYEKAGKEFGSWVNKGPENWSDTEREYFDNFMKWADKN